MAHPYRSTMIHLPGAIMGIGITVWVRANEDGTVEIKTTHGDARLVGGRHWDVHTLDPKDAMDLRWALDIIPMEEDYA
jgi:hypothetical protein